MSSVSVAYIIHKYSKSKRKDEEKRGEVKMNLTKGREPVLEAGALSARDKVSHDVICCCGLTASVWSCHVPTNRPAARHRTPSVRSSGLAFPGGQADTRETIIAVASWS